MSETCGTQKYYPLITYVAAHTVELRDENKFTFIWDNQLILMYFDREHGNYKLLTDVEEHVEKAIFHWLNKALLKEESEENHE